MNDATRHNKETVSSHRKRLLNVKYFAVLRDQTGTSEEQLRTRAETPSDLFDTLRDQYDMDMEPDAFQVAVNHELSTWDTPLEEGDTIAFLPPVAGG
jgi:molybdopterin converting factor subunit 1